MRSAIRWLIVVGVLAGLGFGYYRFQSHWRTPFEDQFRTQAVDRGTIELVRTSSGTVQAVQSVQVGAFVSGPISKVYVDYNSKVKKGDTLAEIDPRTYKATVEQQEALLAHEQADVERVQALLEQAERNEKRALKLRATKSTFISEAEVDELVANRKSLEAQLKLAKASVRQSEATLASARTNLGFTTITAPVDGLITNRNIDPGQTVAASFQTPVLFYVAPDLDKKVFVYASVDEADIGQIRQAERSQRPVTFTVDAYPDDTFIGKIYQIRLNPTTTSNVVTYTVVVESPNTEMKLLPGLTASLTFHVDEHKDVLRVPNSALRFHPDTKFVRPGDRPVLLGGVPESGPSTDTKPKEEKPAAPAAAGQKGTRRYVWKIDGDALAPVELFVGIDDSKHTEVLGGNLAEGDSLVVGLQKPSTE